MGANKTAKLNLSRKASPQLPSRKPGTRHEAGLDAASHNFGTVAADDGRLLEIMPDKNKPFSEASRLVAIFGRPDLVNRDLLIPPLNRIIRPMRRLAILLGGFFVLVVSFVGTTYFLRQFSGVPQTQSVATAPASVAQDGPPPVAQQVRGINLALEVSDFTGPQWQPEGVMVRADNIGSGTSTAFKLVETTDNGMHRIETHALRLTPGDVHTLSVFLRPGDRTNIRFEMRDDQKGKYGIAVFDLLHQKVLGKSGDVTNAGIQAMPNGWFRCWATMPYATDSAVFNFALLDANGAASYPGDGRSGLSIWGPFFYPG
jgi:hypothetical protein